MTKRNAIYLALVIFIAAGFVIDVWAWPAGTPSRFTWNDAIQLVGVVVLSSWWQIADARQRGVRRSGVASTLTVMFVPIGSAVYLFQSRNWRSAVAVYLVFWGGIMLAAAAGAFGATALLAGVRG